MRSGAPRPAMCLRGIIVPAAFAANRRSPLLSGRLPLSGRRVISRVPPCLCDEHLAWRLGGGRSTIVTDARGRIGQRTRNERNCTKTTGGCTTLRVPLDIEDGLPELGAHFRPWI